MQDMETASEDKVVSIASTVSEPIHSPSGPYLQMAYYAVAGFSFWAILMIQLPMIDKYFGGPDVVFYVTFAYGLSSNLIRVYLLWYGARTKSSQARQMQHLIIYGSALTALFLIAYPISMVLLGTDNGRIGFWVAIVLSAMVGLWNSLLMNAGFNLMSLAPEKSASFFLLAQTATGVVTWPLIMLTRFLVDLTTRAGDQTDLIVAAISFSIAACVVAGCVPLYLKKTRNHIVFINVLGPDACVTPAVSPSALSNNTQLKQVFKAIQTPALCVWMCGVLTFCVFPSQVSRWFPLGEFETAIYRSFLIYMFSVNDTIGRTLPRLFPKVVGMSDKIFWTFTIGRGALLAPLFLVSSKTVSDLFSFDWFRLVLIITFAVTNGVNFATCNICGPKRVQTADKIHAGTILSLMAVNGVFIGTLLGIGLKQI